MTDEIMAIRTPTNLTSSVQSSTWRVPSSNFIRIIAHRDAHLPLLSGFPPFWLVGYNILCISLSNMKNLTHICCISFRMCQNFEGKASFFFFSSLETLIAELHQLWLVNSIQEDITLGQLLTFWSTVHQTFLYPLKTYFHLRSLWSTNQYQDI